MTAAPARGMALGIGSVSAPIEPAAGRLEGRHSQRRGAAQIPCAARPFLRVADVIHQHGRGGNPLVRIGAVAQQGLDQRRSPVARRSRADGPAGFSCRP